MLGFMQETCNKIIDTMDNFANTGEAFEVKTVLAKYSMDTIASCAFGVNPQASIKKRSKFVENAGNMLSQNLSDAAKFLLLHLPFDLGGIILRFFNISISKSQETEFFYDVIVNALKNRRDSKSRRNDLLDMMLDAIKGDLENIENVEKSQDQFQRDSKLKRVSNIKGT